ncbi:hypothetical protein CSUI_006596 [Cystoisospora suis]|uniref:Transmembrane protein n=1 Tax=Cystoisospora suis TaxID=483139 RepID=A0A2C6KTK2_9APIC|nr:hypothetical protein CSUI_006596 [Cystoisospora suis]
MSEKLSFLPSLVVTFCVKSFDTPLLNFSAWWIFHSLGLHFLCLNVSNPFYTELRLRSVVYFSTALLGCTYTVTLASVLKHSFVSSQLTQHLET